MHRSPLVRAASGALLTLGIVVIAAAPAAAHVEPDPSRVEPATEATVVFAVEHGCDESPTTKLTFKIPKGVKNAQPVAKDGWSSTTTSDGAENPPPRIGVGKDAPEEHGKRQRANTADSKI